MKRVCLIAFLLLVLTSCGKAGEDSYYIEQQSLLSPDEWSKVALIFGYGDSNAVMCNDFVKAMSVKVSQAPHPAQFRCVPVN